MENKTKTILFFFCIGLFFYIFQTNAFAKEYTVCSSGCNYSKIQDAANIAQAGDIVKIKPGTYNESITPKYSGKSGLPIKYQRDGDGQVIINGTDSWAVIIINGVDYTTWNGLTLVGSGNGVEIRDGNFNSVEYCNISGFNIGIGIENRSIGTKTASNNTVSHNLIHNYSRGTGEGIYIFNRAAQGDTTSSYVQNNIIEYNTFYNVVEALQNTGGNEINGTVEYYATSPTGSNSKFVGNLIYNNACDSGIVDIIGNGHTFANNIVYNNTGVSGDNSGSNCSLYFAHGNNVTVQNNLVYNNSGVKFKSGITFSDMSGNIINNTIHTFSGNGIEVADSRGAVIIKNNIIANITGTQISPSGTTNLTVAYNLFGKSESFVGTNAKIITTPGFINTTNPTSSDYFRPVAGTTACNAGENGTYIGYLSCGSSTNSSPTPTIKKGDTNGDNIVDILDVGIVIDNFKRNPITNPQADLDKNGVVDIVDLGIVIDNYGK